MAIHNSTSSIALLASAAFAILSCGSCLQFSYPNFDEANKDDFSFSPGSGIEDGSLQITPSSGDIANRSGRICFTGETLKLRNSKQKHLTSFRTDFVLNISPHRQNKSGEGMAFILTNSLSLPHNSSGQWLGIANEQTEGLPLNRVVAVEFDTRKSYEEDLDSNHIGLYVNSIKSVAQYPLSSTGEFAELNQIKSWKFIAIDDADSRGGYARKMTWFLFISVCVCAIFAFYVWRRSQRRRRLAYSSIEMMNDVPSM